MTNTKRPKIPARVAGVQELRRSNAATKIPARVVPRERSRRGRRSAAIRRSQEGN